MGDNERFIRMRKIKLDGVYYALQIIANGGSFRAIAQCLPCNTSWRLQCEPSVEAAHDAGMHSIETHHNLHHGSRH